MKCLKSFKRNTVSKIGYLYLNLNFVLEAILLEFNLDEFDEIKKEQAKLNMPLVFGHSDFNRSNILINEILDTNGNKVKRLYAIDFDYSTYLPRGFDFGTYFCSFKHKDYLLGNDGFPSDEEIKFFVEEYRLESEQLQPGYLDDSINSTEQIVKEVKLSTLELYFARTYFSLGMSMQCKDNPEKRDTLMVILNSFVKI